MNKTTLLQGILPAVVTPMDQDQRFVRDSYKALLANVYAKGVHGIYVCGQTGEGLLQTVDQRKSVAEASMEFSPAGKQVIVHVGAYRTADAVELTKHSSGLGVAAVSALPPLGPYTFAEIHAYYQAIAEASNVPLLVYFFPEICPGIKTTEQILELCAIPNVAGLKFTEFDLFRMRRLKQSGAVLFNGRDEILAAGLMMGADGGIGSFYNIVPEMFVELYGCSLRNEWIAARDVQDRINNIIQITLKYPLFPALKQILKWMGIDCGPCVQPRQGLTADQSRKLRQQLEGSGIAFRE